MSVIKQDITLMLALSQSIGRSKTGVIIHEYIMDNGLLFPLCVFIFNT